jgi:PII-like signaling protein
MGLAGEAKLLRIFIGESDKVQHAPLYEVIVREAKRFGLAGATAWRGVLAYGSASRIKTTKILDLSADMPIVIEIADQEDKINAFLPVVNQLFEASKSGGLVTMEKVQVIRYTPGGDAAAKN